MLLISLTLLMFEQNLTRQQIEAEVNKKYHCKHKIINILILCDLLIIIGTFVICLLTFILMGNYAYTTDCSVIRYTLNGSLFTTVYKYNDISTWHELYNGETINLQEVNGICTIYKDTNSKKILYGINDGILSKNHSIYVMKISSLPCVIMCIIIHMLIVKYSNDFYYKINDEVNSRVENQNNIQNLII